MIPPQSAHYPRLLTILIAIAAALCGGCAPSQPFVPYCLQADADCEAPPPADACGDNHGADTTEGCSPPTISGDTFLAHLRLATAQHPGADYRRLVAIAAAATLDAPAPTVIEGDPNQVLAALGSAAVLDQLAIADVFPLATPAAHHTLQGLPLAPAGYLALRNTIASLADPDLAKLLAISAAEHPSLSAPSRMAALQQLLTTSDTTIDFDPYGAISLPDPSSDLPAEALLSGFTHSDRRASRQLTPWAWPWPSSGSVPPTSSTHCSPIPTSR